MTGKTDNRIKTNSDNMREQGRTTFQFKSSSPEATRRPVQRNCSLRSRSPGMDGFLYRASPRQVRSRPASGRCTPENGGPLPKIQTCSGFLGNSKMVIRPIAFKPLSGRLSSGGERYGSTPVLASRPGSHMTLYGSSGDVREARWRSSPQPASLTTLPPPHHARHHSALTPLTHISCKGGAGAAGEPAAPSPADSGVSELERDRDTAHASPAHTDADHNEYNGVSSLQARVRGRLRLDQTPSQFLRRVRDHHDRLPHGSPHDRLPGGGPREREPALRARLEDAEWALAQRAGEISLLKTQLKDAQNEQTAKGHEYLQLKAECRQLRETLERKDREILKLRSETDEKTKIANTLQSEVDRLTSDLMDSVSDLAKSKETSSREIEILKTELKELRQELSDVSLSGYEGIQCGRPSRNCYDVCKTNEYHWSAQDSSLEDAEVQRLNGELPDITCTVPCPANALAERLKSELDSKQNEFNNERRRWSEEKEKVLRYQKQLQLNYVQMFRKTRSLEAQVESLRLELDLCNKSMNNMKLSKTIEL